jgi:hypothetical protein
MFAKLRIRMVDGKSLRREFYSQRRAPSFGARRPPMHSACGSAGLAGCRDGGCLLEVWNGVHVDISSEETGIGQDARHNNTVVARHLTGRSSTPGLLGATAGRAVRRAQAIIRCGERVQLQLSEGFFACHRAEPPAAGQGDGRFANGGMMELCR